MPNHITNELLAPAHVLATLKNSVTGDLIDFNNVIPMPEILRAESSESMLIDWAKIALGIVNATTLSVRRANPSDAFQAGDYASAADALGQSNIIRMLYEGPFPKDFTTERFETFLRYIRCLKEHGHADWYSWSLEKWGTKWNAYQIEARGDGAIRFQTAWSAPLPVIYSLSLQNRADRIRLRWADENTGWNAGDVTLLDGQIVEGGRAEDDSRDAYALALDLCFGGVLDPEYRLTPEGKIEYIEESSTA
jgi:hypothetical protein